MPDPTINHDYERPDRGAEDWHTPLNANFTRLDEDIEIRDLEENRDQYTPTPNAKFFATDTYNVFLGNGTSWSKVELGGGGGGGGDGGGDVFESLRLPGNVPVPVDEPVELFSYTVPRSGVYDIVAATEYDTAPVGENTAALTRILVGDTKEMVERAVLVPIVNGSTFQSIPPAALKIGLNEGQTVAHVTRHGHPNSSLTVASNPFNTAFMIHRTGPLP